MLNKFHKLISYWNQLHISYAGKVILINSILMSIPSYTLSVYPLPDSVLDQLAKLARSFLWHRGGNRSGLSLVAWNRAMLSKTEGGLAIRNLRILRTAYLGNNALKYLNNNEAFWVNILQLKYRLIHPWSLIIPPKCSWFFRSICKILNSIRPHLCLNIVNPYTSSLLTDP